MKHELTNGVTRNAITTALVLELVLMSNSAQADGAYVGFSCRGLGNEHIDLGSLGVGMRRDRTCSYQENVFVSGFAIDANVRNAILRRVLIGYRIHSIGTIEFGYTDSGKFDGRASRHRVSVSYHREW